MRQSVPKLPSQNESYSDDDREFTADLFQNEPGEEQGQPSEDVSQLEHENDLDIDALADEVSKSEQNGMFYILGYCVHSLKRTAKLCNKCIESIEEANESTDASLLHLKEYKPGKLTKVKDNIFQMMLKVEGMSFVDLNKKLCCR